MDEIVKKAFEEVASDYIYFNTIGKGHPRLLIMSGLPMSGKSHLSNMISEKMGGKVCIVRTDKFRPVISKHMGRSQPMYDKKEHALVFDLGQHLISTALDKGWSVIADATNLSEEYRKWAVEAAKGRAEQVLVVFMDISLETAMNRAQEKDRNGSAATPAVYALLMYEKESIDNCRIPYLIINSETDVKPWAETLAKWLEGEMDRVVGTVIPRNTGK